MEQKLFSVLPMNQRFSLEAGHTYQGSIIVGNSVNAIEDFHYVVSIAPYSVIGDGYSTDFVTTSPYTAITEWITIENPTGSVKPNEHQTVNFTITVPDNAPAGGQYAAIIVDEDSEAAADTDVNVKNVLELASVIYADVTGITTRDGAILDNHLPGFSFDNHVTATTTIENKGNVHGSAIIVINATNLITNETIFPTTNEKDKFEEIIMPESTRLLTRSIDNLPPLGAVKISQTVYFNDVVSTNEQVVIICPLWFIALIVFTIVSIVFAFIARHIYRRRAKRFIS